MAICGEYAFSGGSAMTAGSAPQLVTSDERLTTVQTGYSGFKLTFLLRKGLSLDGHEWSMAETSIARCCTIGGGYA
jgi:hypothetical protein